MSAPAEKETADRARAILLGDLDLARRRVEALEAHRDRMSERWAKQQDELEASRRRVKELEDQRWDLERQVEDAATVEAILKAKIERIEARAALALRLLPKDEAYVAVRAALEAE